MLPFVLITTSAGLTVVADTYLKMSKGRNRGEIEAGFLLYALIAVPSVLAFKYIQFGVFYLLWEALTTIIAILVGTFYFKEKFTAMRFLAVVFTLAAIVSIYQT